MKWRNVIGLALLVMFIVAIGAGGMMLHDYLLTVVAVALIPLAIWSEVRKSRRNV